MHSVSLSAGINETFYHQTIIPLLIVTAFLAWQARPTTQEEIPAGFRTFQIGFLSVWAICVAADWLQGPYVYALYAAYGYDGNAIAQLFVAGFGSSLLFGSFAGAFGDRFGRKRSAIAYCVLYILSCLTKHFKNYWVLMLGRVTGGIATSLLFSCFECWLVAEHVQRHKFSDGLLSYMFGLMFSVFYLVAIASGVLGEVVANAVEFQPISEGSAIWIGGNLSPFDLAIPCLVIGIVLLCTLWDENYGAEALPGSSESNWDMLRESANLFMKDRKAVYLCLIVACFEGAMYAFVFNWTPALESTFVQPPYGVIFALFMMACMCGASLATLLGERVKSWARICSLSLLGAVALVASSSVAGMGDEQSLKVCFFSFLIFEFCVGLYFPTIGVLKSEVVPERIRATVYNIFRVPLNAIVVALLLTDISIVTAYRVCAALLVVACCGSYGIGALSGQPALLWVLSSKKQESGEKIV